MNKYEELYNEVSKMLIWAEEQRHINYDQKELLLDNLISIKKSLDRENEE